MPETTYQYSISSDMPEGLVNANRLHDEIEGSQIATALANISITGSDVLQITFADALSPADKTILDGDALAPAGGLLAAHDPHDHEVSYKPRDVGYDYLSQPVLDEVEYTMVDAPTGTYAFMRVYLESGGSSGATVRVGIYSDKGGEPYQKLAEGSKTISALDDDSLVDIDLTAPFVLTNSRKLWLAFLVTGFTTPVPQFISTDTRYGKFHNVRFEQVDTDGGLFPAVASPAKDVGTVAFVAMVE